MIHFLKRIPSALLTLWLVATLVFVLVKAAGGEDILGEGKFNPTVAATIRREWLLDRPVHEQYFMHMGKLLQMDSLPSRKHRGKTLRDVLREHLPISIHLGVRSLIIAICLGIPIGVICALHHNRILDQAGTTFALLGVSVPSFILASLVIFIFSRKLNWLPATEWTQGPWRIWVPAACLAAFPFAAVLRLTRASMLEALREDYVRTANAKGASPWKVVLRHALRNAITPVITYIGPVTAGVLTGSLVVERIFSIPGIGRFFVDSVSNRDMPLIMGLTVFYCALLVFFNLLVDAIYPLINPRLREA